MYGGIDCSTQSLKFLIVTRHHVIVDEVSVNFDAELRHLFPSIKGGVTRATYGLNEDMEKKVLTNDAINSLIVTSPSLMFAAALDLALSKLQAKGFDFSQLVGVAASGQQHGSVWWKKGAINTLNQLDNSRPLKDQLDGCFSLPHAPIWMDSSTASSCHHLEQAIGGAQRMADVTGSRAYERFTGNQIHAIKQRFPDVYQTTERISLVSSMVASMLVGEYASIDAADGAGMNLMDLSTQQWNDVLLKAIDDTGALGGKLGEVCASPTCVGKIASYFTKRYGFNPDCHVFASSGDNPCTLAGMQLTQPGDVGVSLGTSDTAFAVVANAKPSAEEGHVFINPVDPNTRMLMVVFKNGSLTREAVRDEFADNNWQLFNEAIKHTPLGNHGLMKFTYKESEITPTTHSTGTFRFNANDEPVKSFENAVPGVDSKHLDVRALVESQFLSMRVHARRLGLTEPKRIVASGGASVNRDLLQVLADVFNCEVQVQVVRDTSTGRDMSAMNNTAALGAAFRAIWASESIAKSDIASNEPTKGASISAEVVLITAAMPQPTAQQVYGNMLDRFARLEKQVVAQLEQ